MKAKRLGNVFMLAGLLLIAAALCLVGVNYKEQKDAGKASENALEKVQAIIEEKDPIPPIQSTESTVPGFDTPPSELIIPDYILDPNMEMPKVTVDGEEFVGIIEIPFINKVLPVMDSWNYTKLKTSPCRFFGSVYLDNMIILGHNYNTHFGDLKKLAEGDKVIFTDMAGNQFNYRVAQVEVLTRYAVEAMLDGDWDLTLFTCTVDGGSRVTIRCNLEQ